MTKINKTSNIKREEEVLPFSESLVSESCGPRKKVRLKGPLLPASPLRHRHRSHHRFYQTASAPGGSCLWETPTHSLQQGCGLMQIFRLARPSVMEGAQGRRGLERSPRRRET